MALALSEDDKVMNERFCQAVERNAALYDRSHPNYKKKIATENSWDNVSEECNDSAANCKRRWRRIREEFSRCCNNSTNRPAKKKFYLQDKLSFLIPHMGTSAGYQQGNWESENKIQKALSDEKNKRHREINDKIDYSKSSLTGEDQRVKTMKVNTTTLVKTFDIIDLDVEQVTEKQNKEKTNICLEETSRNAHTLAISKVNDPLETIIADEVMQTDKSSNDNVETTVKKLNVDPLNGEVILPARRTRGRHSKPKDKAVTEELHNVKEKVIQKSGTRITRLQNRRMSMSAALYGCMNNDFVTPVKIAPLPKAKQSLRQVSPQLRQQDKQLRIVGDFKSNQVFVPETPVPTVGEVLLSPPNFRSSVSTIAFQQQQQQQRSIGIYGKQRDKVAHLDISKAKQRSTKSMELVHQNQQISKIPSLQYQASDKLIDIKCADSLDNSQVKSRPEPSNNTDKCKWGNTHEVESLRLWNASTIPSENSKKRQDRSVQCGLDNVFTDDDFLNIIRPQMREMNARQKMNFKKKVFQSLMEVFDDATDFPNADEVQHFNINTPSGFEYTTNQELRLLRELVALVSAAKNTQELQKTACRLPGHNSPTDGIRKANNGHLSCDDVSLPRNVVQRVFKVAEGAEGSVIPSGITDKRCFYRIVPKGGAKVVVNSCNKNIIPNKTNQTNNIGVNSGNFSSIRQLTPSEIPIKNRLDPLTVPPNIANTPSSVSTLPATPKFSSNSVTGPNSTTGVNDFVNRAKRESPAEAICSMIQTIPRSQNSLNSAAHISRLGYIDSIASTTSASASSRVMGRRYSVCGLPAAGNAKLALESNARTIKTLANGLLTSDIVGTANANGLQISLKRQMENNANSLLVSRARISQSKSPSGILKVVGQKALGHSLNKKLIGQNTSELGSAVEFVLPATPVLNKNNGTFINNSAYIQSTSTAVGTCKTLTLSAVPSNATSNFPAKHHVTQTNAPNSIQKGLAGSKDAGNALNKLFNDDQHTTAATISADDFSTVRIKHEDDEQLLGI